MRLAMPIRSVIVIAVVLCLFALPAVAIAPVGTDAGSEVRSSAESAASSGWMDTVTDTVSDTVGSVWETLKHILTGDLGGKAASAEVDPDGNRDCSTSD